MDFEGWASPDSGENVEPRFAGKGGRSDFVAAEILSVEWQAFPGLDLGGRRRQDTFVKTGNQNLPVSRLEGRNDLGDGLQRVGRDAAVVAGMEIVSGALDMNFAIYDSAQAGGYRRNFGSEHGGIADHRGVGGQGGRIFDYKMFNMPSAGFLLALYQKLHINRQISLVFTQGLRNRFH